MRAILYLEEIIDDNLIEIKGETAHHLIKVLRIKINSDLLLLNGQGQKLFTKVTSVSKKSLIVEAKTKEFEARKLTSAFSIAICLPKKDAFFEMANQAAQMGIYKIIPVKSEYSQLDLLTDSKSSSKLLKIIESGLVQSNNTYELLVDEQKPFLDLIDEAKNYEQVLYLCSHKVLGPTSKIDLRKNDCGKTLIIIGPEAGLTTEEEIAITQLENSVSLNLSTYIMRAPVAQSVAIGYCLGIME